MGQLGSKRNAQNLPKGENAEVSDGDKSGLGLEEGLVGLVEGSGGDLVQRCERGIGSWNAT